MEVKLPTEGTRYVQALLLTATAYLQYRAHFLPAVAAYRGYGRPAVPKVPVQALRACLAIGHGTLPLPSVAWVGWLVGRVLVCAFVCAFVSAFVCSFRGLFACVLSWVEI